MTDVAELGLKIQSDQVEVATKRLNDLKDASKGAEKAAGDVATGAMRAEAGLKGEGDAAKTAAGALQQAAGASTGAAKASDFLKKAADDAGKGVNDSANALANATKAADKYIASLEKAASQAGKTTAQIKQMEIEANAAAAEKAGLLDHAARIRALGAIDDEAGPSERAIRAGRLNLIRQGSDVFTSGAMGMSPSMIAIQQGPQILDALAQSGIKVGAGMGIAGAAIVAVAGAVAVLGGNAMRTAKDLSTFQGLIDVTADSSAYTAEKMASVSRALDVQGVSAKDARAELAAFLHDGVKPERMQEFGKTAMYMSKVLGGDVVDAAKSVSTAFTGTWDDVKNLDDSLHFLSKTEKDGIQTEHDHIKSLFEQGKAGEARNLAFQLFSEKYGKAYNDSLTSADQLTRNLSGAWDNLVTSLGNTAPIQNATNNIGALVQQLANWLGQYAQVQNLTKQGLQSESDRLYAKLNNPDAAGVYYNESAKAKLTKFEYGPLSWLFAPKTKSPEELRREDEQRMFDIQRQIQGIPAIGDTTDNPRTLPPIIPTGGGAHVPPAVHDDDGQRAIKSLKEQTDSVDRLNAANLALNASVMAGAAAYDAADRQARVDGELTQWQTELEKIDAERKTAKGAALTKLNGEYSDLNDQIAKYRAALEEQQRVDAVTDFTKQTDALQEQNRALEVQVSLIGASNAERERTISLMETQEAIRKSGLNIDLSNPNADFAAAVDYAAANDKAHKLRSTGDGKTFMEQAQSASDAARDGAQMDADTMYMSADAAAAYRKEKELLNEATLQGIALGDKDKQTIHDIAEAYGQTEKMHEATQAAQEWRDTIKGAFMDFTSGAKNFSDALKDILLKFLEMEESKAFDALWNGGLGQKADSLLNWGASIFGGGKSSPGLSVPSIGSTSKPFSMSLAPHYEGGGFTGSGPRAGGLDGRGGFWAVMHPQESVIDHTRGQRGAGGTVQVEFRAFIDEDGKWQARVEKIADDRLDRAGPAIVDYAVNKAADRARRDLPQNQERLNNYGNAT
jgi:uncharacterized phage infection (PIP) family protein YhgE